MKKEFVLKNFEIKTVDGVATVGEVTAAIELTAEEAVVMWKEGGTALKVLAAVAEKVITAINAAKEAAKSKK